MAADYEVTGRLTLDARGAVQGAAVAQKAARDVDGTWKDANGRLRNAKGEFIGVGQSSTVAATGIGRVRLAVAALMKTGLLVFLTSAISLLSKMGAAIQAAGVQQLAEAKLGNSLRNLGEDADEGVKSIKALAGELQNVTAVGDEVQLTGLSILGTFKSVGGSEGLKILAPRLLDIAAANKEAGQEITSLKGEALALGKALDGQASLLRRYGVSLSDTEIAALNAASGLEKVELLAAALDKNFAGAAQAAADPMKVMQAAVGDLLEELGGTDGTGLRGAATGAAVRLTALAQQKDVQAAFRFTGRVIGGLIRFLLDMADGSRVAFAVLKIGAADAQRAVARSLTLTLTLIQNTAAALTGLAGSLPGIGPAMANAFGKVTQLAGEAAGAMEMQARAADFASHNARQNAAALSEQIVASRVQADTAAALTAGMHDAGLATDELTDATTKATDAAADMDRQLDQVLVTASRTAAEVDALAEKLDGVARAKAQKAADDLRLTAAKAYVEARAEALALDRVNLGVTEGLQLLTEKLAAANERVAAGARLRYLRESGIADEIARERVEMERLETAAARVLALAMKRANARAAGADYDTAAADALATTTPRGAQVSETTRAEVLGDLPDASAEVDRLAFQIRAGLVASVKAAEDALSTLGEAYANAKSDEERKRIVRLSDEFRKLREEMDETATAGDNWWDRLAGGVSKFGDAFDDVGDKVASFADRIQYTVSLVAEATALMAEHAANQAREADQTARESAQEAAEARRDAEEGNTQALREAADEKERIAARDAQLAEQAFERQKAAAKRAALINTALAVTNALATVQPFIPNAVAAAAMAGLAGAVQVAAIEGQTYAAPNLNTSTPSASSSGSGSGSSASAGLYVANGGARRDTEGPAAPTVNVSSREGDTVVNINGRDLEALIDEIEVRQDRRARNRGSRRGI